MTSKSGFSLVELMVTAVILAVLAMGGAAVLYHTGGNIQIQGNKRIALEIANNILETEKAKEYIKIPTPSKEPRTVVVDSIPHDITIIRNKFGNNIANEYKQIRILVGYTAGGDFVEISTTRSFE